MRPWLKKHFRSAKEDGFSTEVLFDQRVFGYMIQELSKDPSVEEGGKYVGYLLPPGSPLLQRLNPKADRAILIVDFLPSGPNATRTAVELQPDGPFQERLFREIERVDSAIEHLGTWHSHHCNGLRRLSSGDVGGYFRTIANPAYRPDVLVASLVKDVPNDVTATGWIDHYLFIRGEHEYHNITDRIRIVEAASAFTELTGHGRRPLFTPKTAGLVTPVPTTRDPVSPVAWFETTEGRGILADDKRFFENTLGPITATRRDSRITITAHIGSNTVAVTYPRNDLEADLSLELMMRGIRVFQMNFPASQRNMAYAAVLAVLGSP